MIEFVASSEKGRIKNKNEDRVLVNNKIIYEGSLSGKKEDSFLTVVCDGVGGTNGGEIAAEIAASGFIDINIDKLSPGLLKNHMRRINDRILDEQRLKPEYPNMATAVTGIAFWKNQYMLFNLGDSRIYDIKNGELRLKTKDHILEKENNNYNFPGTVPRKVLTRFMGGPGFFCNPDIARGYISERERYFIVCSDGIYKRIDKEKMRHIISEGTALEEKKRAILLTAVQNGSTDDRSIVLVRYSSG